MSSCIVEGCPRPPRLAKMCSAHHSRKLNGRPLIRPCKGCGLGDSFGQSRYHPECRPTMCVICHEKPVGNRFADLCSGRCYQIQKRNPEGIPRSAECNRCGSPIDLWEKGKAGRKRRQETLICQACRAARSTRHKTSTSVLAQRDGTDCGICAEPIDMSLKSPDLMRASVDHVIPYSLGGAHDESNLQLAHLHCNHVKHNREGFTISTVSEGR